MTRLIVFLLAVTVAALGAAWIAARPGDVAITWMGYRIETSLMVAIAAVAFLGFVLALAWSAFRLMLRSPRLVAQTLRRRRHERGQHALSRGLLAIASGDLRLAQRSAAEADRLAAAEPLTLLLRAQAAQLAGDRAAADGAFRQMVERPETHLLGLRGLYVEAQRRGDVEAARQHAEAAARRAPALPWAGQARFEFCCGSGDWQGALAALETNFRNGLVERADYRRRRGVLLTARALDLAERDPEAARGLASEAVKLAPDLVPAAALSAKLAAEAGEWRRAGRLVEAAWRRNPHPDLAEIYAHLRFGDSARDRLARVQYLARLRPDSREAALALARAALGASDFRLARATLAPLLDQPTQRVALMMAELEEAESGDSGRAREWMARALRLAGDPAWTADGVVSDRWLPVSPVSGRIDAFVWKTPVAEIARAETPAMSAPPVDTIDTEPAIAAEPASDLVSAEPLDAAPSETEPSQSGEKVPNLLPLSSGAARTGSTTPRTEPIIPLMHAPDDPGPDVDVDGDAKAASASPQRYPTSYR
jgi:HemY protein